MTVKKSILMRSVLWQFLLPQHVLSRMTGKLAYCKIPLIKNTLISVFIRRYKVDMQLAKEPDPKKYETFNAFFTRELKEKIRAVAGTTNTIISPADGAISQCGPIEKGRIFQAKGATFDLQALLGDAPNTESPFTNGHFATIYLSPKDYHRVHMPLSGRLCEMRYIPGKLFSVNTNSVEKIPALFAKNERVVALFEGDSGPFAVILVGAMIVASIETVWSGLVAPQRTKKVQQVSYGDTGVYLKKGDEMGRFQLGSTVILLFPNKNIRWENHIGAGESVVWGQALGELKEQIETQRV